MNEIIKIIQELKISPNQYFYLYFLFKQNFEKPYISIEELELIEDSGYIRWDDNESKFILRNKGRNLFETKEGNLEQSWLEFNSRYPIKSGVRRLHDSPDKCKTKYKSLIKNKPKLHLEILLGLKNEQLARIEASSKREFMADWKLMSSWLNNSSWKTYLDYKEIEEDKGYGKDI